MRKPLKKQFDRKGRFETLEDRRVMSADPLSGSLGEGIVHHSFDEPIVHHGFVEESTPIEHHLASEPDFWLDPSETVSIEEQLGEIEQTLSSAHNTTGLNEVLGDYGLTGKGQTVAIIDSGIAYNHFALGGGLGANYRVVGGYDFTENDADPYDDGPEGSHGTHVAGIVGGDAGADHGVASGVDLVALRVFDDSGAGYMSWVESALQWVHDHRNDFENPITAVNLSLGIPGYNSSSSLITSLDNEFVQLKSDGIFISVSAGNDWASYNTPGLGNPASSPNVVPVMSVKDNGQLASYSQRHVNAIAAPGSSIRSTVPDYIGNNNGIDDDYAYYSGTSMAAPYIAGASVLIREAMEFVGTTGITQDIIYDHMRDTADEFLDAATNLTFKRINIEAAIDALMPSDDFGSTVATAFNLGNLTSTVSQSGVIGTLNDIDYFKFTASSNGTVTFEADNMTHDLEAAWTVSGSTGTVSGNDNESFSFDVTAGQTYTVGFSSSEGLGYYDIGATLESSFSYVDWGTVSYAELNGLSVSGESWYRVQAGQAGFLTVEGMFATQGGQVNLDLYDANMQMVNSGNAANGMSRVDVYAAAGEEFYICVQGDNDDVDYRLSNLVSVTGTTVNVTGTAGDDTFAFTAGDTHQVTVNGVTHEFAAIAVTNVDFDGGAGADSIVLTGTSGDETVRNYAGQVDFFGNGFEAQASSVENVQSYGGGGVDIAYLYDSTDADKFTAASTFAVLRADDYNFYNQVNGFKQVFATSTSGSDTATLYDSAGNDRFVASPTFAVMRAEDYSYYNQTNGFKSVTAVANSGFDQATLNGSTGADRFVASPTFAVLRAADSTYYNEANGFDSVVALGGDGSDQATLYGAAGADRFVASPSFGVLKASDFSYYNEANGFESVTALGSGGADQATLYDSTGADRFVTSPSFAVLRALNGSYYNEANGFNTVTAVARDGLDEAVLYGSAGPDRFVGSPTFGVIRAQDYSYYYEANGFDQVTAISNGGADESVFYDSAGSDKLVASALFTSLQSVESGYYLQASGFRTATATSTAGGFDTAELRDSELDDLLFGRGSDATISGLTYSALARGFQQVYAKSEGQIGNDVIDVEAVDYVFSTVGQWS